MAKKKVLKIKSSVFVTREAADHAARVWMNGPGLQNWKKLGCDLVQDKKTQEWRYVGKMEEIDPEATLVSINPLFAIHNQLKRIADALERANEQGLEPEDDEKVHRGPAGHGRRCRV